MQPQLDLQIDRRLKEPLTKQIRRQIRAKIIAGQLGSGTQLPAIRLLAQQQQVSAIIVQRAYEGLVEEGYLQSRSKKGFYVKEIPVDKRKNMALGLLQERCKVAVSEALAAGISRTAIRGIIAKILKS